MKSEERNMRFSNLPLPRIFYPPNHYQLVRQILNYGSMKNKKTQLKHLKKSARDSLVTLQPSKDNPDKFKASFLYFEGYLDLFTTIESLINVCILATQGDTYCPPHIKEHEPDIRKTLKLAAQLLPFEEGEFLDGAYGAFIMKDYCN